MQTFMTCAAPATAYDCYDYLWVWITIGVVAAAGIGVGIYFAVVGAEGETTPAKDEKEEQKKAKVANPFKEDEPTDFALDFSDFHSVNAMKAAIPSNFAPSLNLAVAFV